MGRKEEKRTRADFDVYTHAPTDASTRSCRRPHVPIFQSRASRWWVEVVVMEIRNGSPTDTALLARALVRSCFEGLGGGAYD